MAHTVRATAHKRGCFAGDKGRRGFNARGTAVRKLLLDERDDGVRYGKAQRIANARRLAEEMAELAV